MRLPQPVLDLLRLYALRFPIPTGAPGDEHEANVRAWATRFAEQAAFTYGPVWGMKRADPNRPISKDTITRQANGSLDCWDLLIGTGTGSPRLADDPAHHDINGQVFVPVTPTNHLGAVVPPPPDPGPVPPAVDFTGLLARFDALDAAVKALHVEQQLSRAILADLYQRKAPAYVGTVRLWGGPSRFTPEEKHEEVDQ